MINQCGILITVLLLTGCASKDVYLTETYNGSSSVTTPGGSSDIFAISQNDNIYLITSRLNSVDGYHKLKRRGFFTFFIEVANTGTTSRTFTPKDDLKINLLEFRTGKVVELPFETGNFSERTLNQRLGAEHNFTREFAAEIAGSYAARDEINKVLQSIKSSWLQNEINELAPKESVNGFVLVEIDDLDQMEGRSRLDIGVAIGGEAVSTQYVLVCRKYRGLESKKC